MKILITGGGGFVGSWLSSELIKQKHKVVIIDPFLYFSNWDDKTKKVIEKFKHKQLLSGVKIYKGKFEKIGLKVVKKEKPEVIIHLAGIPLEKPQEFKFSLKQLKQDIALTYAVVEAVKENNVKKLIFMSSISAYGDCSDIIHETDDLLPKTPYGVTKAAGEFLVRSELNNWNIVRTTNIYGFGDMNGRGNNIILNKILKGEEFWVNSDITVDFTYVKDLVNGIIAIMKKAPDREIFHISGGHARKLTDYVDLLKKRYKFEYKIKDIHDRPKRGTMNIKKAKDILGWEPRSFESGVNDYLKYVSKYKVA